MGLRRARTLRRGLRPHLMRHDSSLKPNAALRLCPIHKSDANMVSLAKSNLANAPDHPVLVEPWTFDVLGLNYLADKDGHEGDVLKLVLEREGTEVALRFTGVHELETGPEFPHSYLGLEILDVSHLGWVHSKVRVQCFECSGIRFWARSVERAVV